MKPTAVRLICFFPTGTTWKVLDETPIAVGRPDEACIACCACVKSCPTGARVMEQAPLLQIAEKLSAQCAERKDPEVYL